MQKNLILSLGGNSGNVEETFGLVKKNLSKWFGMPVLASSIYQTAPWGKTDQPDFLNQVLAFQSNFSIFNIFQEIQKTEMLLGRNREIEEKWGPRKIDIDILFFDNYLINTANLTVPHPEIINRRFILEPLSEILPDFIHPVLKVSISMLLKSCKDQSLVTKLK